MISRPEDIFAFDLCYSSLSPHREEDTGALVLRAARFFTGSPYAGYTLDADPDGLVAGLTRFDCQTLVESCLALVRCVRDGESSFDSFCRHLQNVRYRDGRLGYGNRLIYFSDWITDNQRKGYVRDMTGALGGADYPVEVNYWSRHPELYVPLKDGDRMEAVKRMEREVSGRNIYRRVSDPAAISGLVRDGDIIAFTTNRPGLDITHVAIACHRGEHLSFIHATSVGNLCVELFPGSLGEYVRSKDFVTGIMVARPL